MTSAAGETDEASEDAALVEAARAGPPRDRWAWERLYGRYAPMVHAVLLVRVGSADADDATQEVFIKAMRSVRTLREAASVGPWLASIARSKAVDCLRSRKRWKLFAMGAATEAAREQAAPVEGAGLSAQKVLAAVRALPEAYQETLAMRLIEGMTGPEIAASLGMTHGSVRVNLTRGMQMLRERLGPEVQP